MGDEAIRLIPKLKTLYRVGLMCESRGDYSFTFREVEKRLDDKDEWEIRRDLDATSAFFRRYFDKFGYPEGTKVELAGDQDYVTVASRKLKIIDRGRGKWRTTICDPLGREALRLAREFLWKVGQLPQAGHLNG
jgi:hypothetical protein